MTCIYLMTCREIKLLSSSLLLLLLLLLSHFKEHAAEHFQVLQNSGAMDSYYSYLVTHLSLIAI